MDKANVDNLSREQRLLTTKKVGIEGMTCDKCAQKVERAFQKVNGVSAVKVDRASAVATVTYDNSKTDIPELIDTLLKSGYKPKGPFE